MRPARDPVSPGAADGDTESKSARKRAMQAWQARVEALLVLAPQALAAAVQDAALRAEFESARGMRKGAYRRQVRYLARRLAHAAAESADDEARVTEALEGPRANASEERMRRAAEAWRTRLLEEGERAVDALVAECPRCDRTRLRALVRAARTEEEAGRRVRARALFRAVRAELMAHGD